MICLVCGGATESGAYGGRLCRTCAGAVPPCEGLIPDHIRSTVTMTDGEAWLVDGFGSPHAVPPKATLGRNHEGEVVVLASSVSREHAELRHVDGAWQVRDLGSRNGTFVDGARCQGRVVLPTRSVLKLGDVALWFLVEPAHAPEEPLSMATGAAGGLVRFAMTHAGVEMCVVGASIGGTGGALLSRATGAQAWSERALPPLEFQLLRTLCSSAHAEADSLATARGCVATKQLARELPFQSKYANEENVRQVVRRLRGALTEIGADGILSVVPGRGYYLACAVTVSGANPR
ncbi:MAG: FHA domain-containing protein [Deltaproteobacteria bacterium]|nr:FHA domain-containing protein [Deltaproteobacteria bacterium]